MNQQLSSEEGLAQRPWLGFSKELQILDLLLGGEGGNKCGQTRIWCCLKEREATGLETVSAPALWLLWCDRAHISDSISGTAGDPIKNRRKLPAFLQQHNLLCDNLSDPRGMPASLGHICIPTSLPHPSPSLKFCHPSLGSPCWLHCLSEVSDVDTGGTGRWSLGST